MPSQNGAESNSNELEHLPGPEQANQAENTRKCKWRPRKEHIFWILVCASLLAVITVLAIINKCDCRSIQACPPSWIGYKENCYYFSKAERNWTSSQKFCSSHNASLARIEEKDQDFVMLNKGKGSCWIGLTRDSGQPWKWLDGGNSTLEVMGDGGDCAYFNDETKASSARCYVEHCWICRKSAASTCLPVT
ncbi:C-type lectin domain family 2 member D-like [Varanus komodoensis]|uniref:C-type lectin domain family 2 member D-like n=1 Tax=Varanus komodoensis TaxID=61221 RepID=UPI001CF79094|nr:C-type lectin domain family 2 member D-like [Varanus komodoensis]XP_044275564.1 C-type lectin domain family 2 member D-like [Varanus komodoensis]XP_044275565.1 C-type lectin domain family 2 member D-like [Varanus komodoensis]XP_044275566.1 C-type lectin domain family 2 member D-like [Varanus komodoensis]XP_044275567.1 C-type lectin domain family 2 member D-like [Varanus komodoensis]XP_044275568.1 C-type lectin domain family 2 member D-like [Varanus komodoensis]